MKKLNEILFSLISPVILGEGVSSETAAVDERTFRAVYALAKKHDLANLLAGAARCANAQMQNAKCKMQNERTVGDAGPYGDTRCANAQMQNAECEKKNGECGISAEFMAELEKAELTAAWRVRNIENEQGRVRKCLEEAEIPFILLKGAVVRDFYPEAWMRTSSDIDVLVPRGELSHAVCAIEDGLGYRISTVEPHDASMYAKSGVHLDMHTVFEGDREDCKLLDEAWGCALTRKCKMQNAKCEITLSVGGADSSPEGRAPYASHSGRGGTEGDGEGVVCANAQMQNAECGMQNERTVGDAGPYGDTGCANAQMRNAECGMKNAECGMQNVGYERFLTPEHFYFYHVAHMAAHMRNGGCGIRPFIDLYLIRRNMPCERAVLDGMLSEYGLARFDEASVALAERWMCAGAQMQNGGLSEEQLSAFEEYVLMGGVYGSGEQYVAAKQRGGKQGKAKYVLGRIFMPYEQLKLRHPRLDGHRWLTPVFEVYRWCSLVVPSRLRRSKKELSSAMRVDNAKVTSVEELLDSLEL